MSHQNKDTHNVRSTAKDVAVTEDQSDDNPPELGTGEDYDEAPDAKESDADYDAPEQNAKEATN